MLPTNFVDIDKQALSLFQLPSKTFMNGISLFVRWYFCWYPDSSKNIFTLHVSALGRVCD
jgi:flagellar biosynthesis protein FliP